MSDADYGTGVIGNIGKGVLAKYDDIDEAYH